MSTPLDPFSILNKGQIRPLDLPQKKQRYWGAQSSKFGQSQQDQNDFNENNIKPNEEEDQQNSDDDMFIEKKVMQPNNSMLTQPKDKQLVSQPETQQLSTGRQIQQTVILENKEDEANIIKIEDDDKKNSSQVKVESNAELQQKPQTVQVETQDYNKRAALKAKLLAQEKKQVPEFQDAKQDNLIVIKDEIVEYQGNQIIVEERKRKVDNVKKEFASENNDNKNANNDSMSNINESTEKKKNYQTNDEIIMEAENDNEDQDENESSNEEQQYDDNQRQITKMLKPVFLSKDKREQQSGNQADIENDAFEVEKKKQQERIKSETKSLLIQAVKAEEKKGENEEDDEKNSTNQDQIPDDNDEINQDFEYEMWKIRELKRIKMERTESSRWMKQQEEIERRRNMTDQQRQEENKKLGSDGTNKSEKAVMRYMQKYYHKGVFYQDDPDDELMKRDFNLPVAEELFDKQALPKILQKRRATDNKSRGTKWTHLTDQDTTSFDPDYKIDETLFKQAFLKSGGLKGSNIFSAEPYKKQKK